MVMGEMTLVAVKPQPLNFACCIVKWLFMHTLSSLNRTQDYLRNFEGGFGVDVMQHCPHTACTHQREHLPVNYMK